MVPELVGCLGVKLLVVRLWEWDVMDGIYVLVRRIDLSAQLDIVQVLIQALDMVIQSSALDVGWRLNRQPDVFRFGFVKLVAHTSFPDVKMLSRRRQQVDVLTLLLHCRLRGHVERLHLRGDKQVVNVGVGIVLRHGVHHELGKEARSRRRPHLVLPVPLHLVELFLIFRQFRLDMRVLGGDVGTCAVHNCQLPQNRSTVGQTYRRDGSDRSLYRM